jgi:hypothetical protein
MVCVPTSPAIGVQPKYPEYTLMVFVDMLVPANESLTENVGFVNPDVETSKSIGVPTLMVEPGVSETMLADPDAYANDAGIYKKAPAATIPINAAVNLGVGVLNK